MKLSHLVLELEDLDRRLNKIEEKIRKCKTFLRNKQIAKSSVPSKEGEKAAPLSITSDGPEHSRQIDTSSKTPRGH